MDLLGPTAWRHPPASASILQRLRTRPNSRQPPAFSLKKRPDPSTLRSPQYAAEIASDASEGLLGRCHRTGSGLRDGLLLQATTSPGAQGRFGSDRFYSAACSFYSRDKTRAPTPATFAPARVAVLFAQGIRATAQTYAHQARPSHPTVPGTAASDSQDLSSADPARVYRPQLDIDAFRSLDQPGAFTQRYLFDISLLDRRAQPLYGHPHYKPIECMVFDKRPWICFYGGSPPTVVAETDDWWYTMYDREGGCCLQGWPMFLLQDFMRLFADPPPSPEPTTQADDAASSLPGDFVRERFLLPANYRPSFGRFWHLGCAGSHNPRSTRLQKNWGKGQEGEKAAEVLDAPQAALSSPWRQAWITPHGPLRNRLKVESWASGVSWCSSPDSDELWAWLANFSTRRASVSSSGIWAAVNLCRRSFWDPWLSSGFCVGSEDSKAASLE